MADLMARVDGIGQSAKEAGNLKAQTIPFAPLTEIPNLPKALVQLKKH